MTLAVYTVTPSDPWPLPTLRDHPRLFLTPTRLERLRALWADPPVNFTKLKSTIDGDSQNISRMIRYLATGTLSNLTKAYDSAIAQSFSAFRGSYQLYADDSAFVLDWGWADLTAEQRSALIAQLEAFNAQREAMTPNGPLAGCGQEQGYVGYALGVLAIEGEEGATSRLATLRNMLQNESAWIDETQGDGHWVGYSHEVVNFLLGAVMPYHIAGNEEDLITSRFKFAASRNSYLAYRTTNNGYCLLAGPSDHKAMGVGTNKGSNVDGTLYSAKAEFAFHNAAYADVLGSGLAQDRANNCSINSPSQNWTDGQDSMMAAPAWAAFVFYDAAIAAVSPSMLPPSAIFPVPGLVAFRSGWTQEYDVKGWLFCSLFNNVCHDNHYAGSLTISRGDDQLICDQYTYAGQPCAWEDGAPTSKEVGTYSMCNSTVVISPTGSATPDRSGSQTHVLNPASAAAFPVSTRFGGSQASWLAGTVGNFSSNDNSPGSQAWATADYGNAYYPNAVVTSIQRIVVFQNGEDEAQGTFFVRDVFDVAPGAADRVRAFFGCRQKPVGMTDETIVKGGSAAGVLTYPNQPVVIQWRNSQATIQMVSPDPVLLRLVGGGNGINGAPSGPGYESYFDGANLDYYANSQSGKNDPQYARIKGHWRLECETTPDDAGGEMVFAITVGDIGESRRYQSRARASPSRLPVRSTR